MESDNLKSFPNPVSDKCSIFSSNIISEITLLNSAGEVLDRINVNDTTYSLDMLKYPNALYFVEVTNNTGNKSRLKIVVVH
ncbi:MAG: T9SS type A sorting domain-containing protein [Bacteroidetes bacterium]|nr:T9SS type A sorting domain-containing protein [Bacteroidota bacterium]